ncbi:PREDICTED: histone H3.v1-like [Amphimedon queenslandica]|uniref:Uncharacterized protein n=1 Tax=Amphimedon queenslandica TaxID=400682 RepID=A0A1X7VCU4_AMPQE|nr:PREDICTED: histone H3.v1-like [Amphimedon queenslandica]|eukprot:XP_011402522.2 PREDICTED: histone H3.v1-like [Amphimedon queenslandica]
MSFEGLEAELRLLKLENEYNKTAATLYSTGSKLNLIYHSLLKESLNITTTINEVEQDQRRRRQPRQYNSTTEQPTTSNHALPSSSTDLQQEETEREGDNKDSEGDDSSGGDEITYNKRRRRKRTKLVMPKVKRAATNKKQKSAENFDTLTPPQSTSDTRNKAKKSNKTIKRASDKERREIEKDASIPPSCTLSTCSYSSHVSLKPFTLAISRISHVPTQGGAFKEGGDKGEAVSSNQPRSTTPVVPSPLSNGSRSDSEWEMSSEISIQNYTENRKRSETVRNRSSENTRTMTESTEEPEPEAEDASIIGRRRRVAEQKVQVIIITSDESEEVEEKSKSKKEKRTQSRPTLTSKRYSSRPKTHVVSYREESEEESESSSSRSLVTDEEEVLVTKKAQSKSVGRPRKLKRPTRAIYVYESDSEDEERRNRESVSPLQSRRNIPESEESDSLIPETPQKTRRLTRLNLLRLSNANANPPPLPLISGNDCTASPIPHLSPPLLVPSPHDSPSEHSSPIKRASKRGRQIQSSPIKDRHLLSQSEASSPRMATRSSREALQEKQNNSPITKRTTRACTGNNNESNAATSSVSCTGRANSQSDATGDTASSVTENERNAEESVSSRELPPPSNHPKKRRKLSRPLPLPLVNQSGLSIMEITSSRISTMGLRRKTVLDSRHNSTTLLYDTYDEGPTNTSRASIRVNNSKFIAPKLKLSKKDKAL